MRPKPELRPPDRDGAEADPRQVADRVHRDLRVVGAGLHARSPPRAAPGRAGRRGSGAGRAARPGWRSARPKRSRPSASRKRPGPKPKVMVSPPGGSPSASPVSSGGSQRVHPRWGRSAGRPACGHPLGGRGPRLQQRDQRRPRAVVTSNAAKCRRSCAGCHDAGLVHAVEGVRRAAGRRRGRVGGVVPAARYRPRSRAEAGDRGRHRRSAPAARAGRAARSREDRRRQLRQRLGEGVDRVGQRLTSAWLSSV